MVQRRKCEVRGHLLLLAEFNESILEITNGFSAENFIGNFQFGEVYRGTDRGKEVTVKLWKDQSKYKVLPGDNECRFEDEIHVLEHLIRNRPHTSIAKMLGFCVLRKPLAVVYHLKPLDTVNNLIEKDGFTWPQRIKVGLGIASLLEFMHAENPECMPYLIRNIDAAHFMLDQDYKPILFDFSMISGGILTDKKDLLNQYVDGCRGYVDPVCARPGKWSDKCDVFSYGVLLLALISKRVYKDEGDISQSSFVYEWAKNEYKRHNSKTSFGKSKSSHVHQSLELGPYFYSSDGIKITKLAMSCVDYNPRRRPTMKQVVRYLWNLHILQFHSEDLKIEQMFNDDDILQKVNVSGRRSSREEYDMVQAFSYKDLSEFTNCFSKENLIGKFQFGEVFSGKIKERTVMIKRYEKAERFERYYVVRGDNEGRDEIDILQHPKLINHPNLVKMIGYCHEEGNLGAVYDLDPLGSVYELAQSGNFTWLQRIKVGYELACLLKFLHADDPHYLSYIVRNLDAAHIMVDKDFSPKLFEFGMITGGIILDERDHRNKFLHGCYGYIDPAHMRRGGWSEVCDVYAYGMILLGLISKKIFREEDKESGSMVIANWAISEYASQMSEKGSSQSLCSLVDCSLMENENFDRTDGAKVTELALQCIEKRTSKRPTMKQVVKLFRDLHVVRRHADTLGIKHEGW